MGKAYCFNQNTMRILERWFAQYLAFKGICG